MKHIIEGRNFHGHYRVVLMGPEEGFVLSSGQIKKVDKALCGFRGCKCKGNYGDGASSSSAKLVAFEDGTISLIPRRI